MQLLFSSCTVLSCSRSCVGAVGIVPRQNKSLDEGGAGLTWPGGIPAADSHWELQQLSRGRSPSRAEFASVRRCCRRVQRSVGVSVLRFSSCRKSKADIPSVVINTLTDSIIDNAGARLRDAAFISQGGCDFGTDRGAFRALDVLIPASQQLRPALSLFKICS